MSFAFGQRFGGGTVMCCLAVAAVLSSVPVARAAVAETEVREFEITIDGSVRGSYRMTIHRHDDGTVSMTGQASVLVKKLGITLYRYNYSGTEWWQDGKESQLIGLKSSSDDNGSRFEVQVARHPNGLQVTVNGQKGVVRGDVWTTTYWRLAHGKFHNKNIPLLDADTGRDFNGRLDSVGTEQINIAGQNRNCRHYRVTGGPNPVDLWYDGQDRLVRQDFVEDGHRTVLRLASISR